MSASCRGRPLSTRFSPRKAPRKPSLSECSRVPSGRWSAVESDMGIDAVNDGEFSKPEGFSRYVTERIGGIEPREPGPGDARRHPDARDRREFRAYARAPERAVGFQRPAVARAKAHLDVHGDRRDDASSTKSLPTPGWSCRSTTWAFPTAGTPEGLSLPCRSAHRRPEPGPGGHPRGSRPPACLLGQLPRPAQERHSTGRDHRPDSQRASRPLLSCSYPEWSVSAPT